MITVINVVPARKAPIYPKKHPHVRAVGRDAMNATKQAHVKFVPKATLPTNISAISAILNVLAV